MIYLEASELEKAANLFVVLVSSCLLDLKKNTVLVIENPGNRTSVVKNHESFWQRPENFWYCVVLVS